MRLELCDTEHDDLSNGTLVADEEYWCQHCHRTFFGRDAARDFFGAMQGCPYEGCGASGLGIDVFAANDPYVTGEGGYDHPDADAMDLRDHLLGIETMRDVDAVADFEGLRLSRVAELIEFELIELEPRERGGPGVVDCVAFMCRWPEVTLHGHALHPERAVDGGAVRVEGIACVLDEVRDGRRAALREAFLEFAKGADAIEEDAGERLRASWGLRTSA